MTQWAAVSISDHVPQIRGGQGPFFNRTGTQEEVTAWVQGFANSDEIEAVPTVLVDDPAYDPTYQLLQPYTSITSRGTQVAGHYVDGEWRYESRVVDMSLEEVRRQALLRLEQDYQARLESGYVVGPYKLVLSKQALAILSTQHYAFSVAVTAGQMQNTNTVLVEDSNRRHVPLNLSQLTTHLAAYFKMLNNVNLIYGNAVDALVQAKTVQAVLAVTWNFA